MLYHFVFDLFHDRLFQNRHGMINTYFKSQVMNSGIPDVSGSIATQLRIIYPVMKLPGETAAVFFCGFIENSSCHTKTACLIYPV